MSTYDEMPIIKHDPLNYPAPSATISMDTLRKKMKEFNSHSSNTENHFKLCDDDEVRLCSTHPRLITCTADETRIHLMHTGPAMFSMYLYHSDPECLNELLAVMHKHRDDGDSLLDWELEDWVSAGYPCKMYTVQQNVPEFPPMGFAPADLWCVDVQPRSISRVPGFLSGGFL